MHIPSNVEAARSVAKDGKASCHVAEHGSGLCDTSLRTSASSKHTKRQVHVGGKGIKVMRMSFGGVLSMVCIRNLFSSVCLRPI